MELNSVFPTIPQCLKGNKNYWKSIKRNTLSGLIDPPNFNQSQKNLFVLREKLSISKTTRIISHLGTAPTQAGKSSRTPSEQKATKKLSLELCTLLLSQKWGAGVSRSSTISGRLRDKVP